MLKTLEEPPEHVKFILATTDPQKIPVTVLSRCLQFNLKQMPPGHIVGHLENILGQEQIAFDPPALRLLAHGAHGSMRDALSLTDQAIAYAAGKVTLEAVQGMLGALDQSYLVRVLDALAAKDGSALLAVADEMAARSLSYNVALQDLGSLLHRIALAQTVPAALPDDVPERDAILRLASSFDAEEIQLFYQIVVHGRNELGLAPDEYAGFSMTLLRMLAFRPGIDAAEAKPVAPAVAPARLQTAPQAMTASVPAGRSGVSPARAALAAARNGGKPPAALPVPPAPPWDDDAPVTDSPPAPAQKKTEPRRAEVIQKQDAPVAAADDFDTPAQPAVQETRPLVLQAVPSLNWDGNWPALAAALPVRGVAQQLALQSELTLCEAGDTVTEFHLRIPLDTLRSAGSVDKLAAALSEHFGKTVRVKTEIGAVEQTANAHAQADREARQREAEESVSRDPFVQSLMREFGATIVPGSIKPV
jgi:DNA polymerase-3 subunit gamma/tau